MNAPTYTWQPTSAEIAHSARIDIADVVRFDHNTSPISPDWVLDVVTPLTRHLNEYPGASYRSIREAAARYVGLAPEQIMPGAGIDELLLLAGRALLGPGMRAVAATPSYPLYEIATAQTGARFVDVASSAPRFEFPAADVIDAAATADLVWLCVPSNPIGTTIDLDVVESVIVATNSTVVIDAAYAEFDPNRPDWADLVARHDNVIVMRTLSKGFGLAGIRVGYAMAHPRLVEALDSVRPPGSIASLSVELAIAALDSPHCMEEAVASIRNDRAGLRSGLAEIGITAMASVTNFLLCPIGAEAQRIAREARDVGLVIRTFDSGPLTQYLRFTVRTPKEHDRLLVSLQRSLR